MASRGLDVQLPRIRQGDVLVTDRLPIIVAPGAPLTADEAGAPPGEPVTTMEVLASSGLLAVVSQDCDLDRAVTIEPYLVAAPLRELGAAERRGPAAMRQSMRYWPFPDPEARGREFVLDARVMVTLSKGVLTVVPILRDHLQEPERATLREWLGARLGRAAWDAEVERKLVRPLERAIAQVGSAAGAGSRVLGAVRFVGLRYTPGRPDCSVLMLTDPVALHRSGADEGAVTGVRRQLVEAIHRRVAAAGGTYIPRVVLADATMVSAADLLEHAPVDVDLPVEEEAGA